MGGDVNHLVAEIMSAMMNRRALGRWELLVGLCGLCTRPFASNAVSPDAFLLQGWLNDFLCLDLSKVEECADGVACCQLVDAVFPGKIALNKLNWNARTPDERLKNLRVRTHTVYSCRAFLVADVRASRIVAEYTR